jgi:hypothetical protein
LVIIILGRTKTTLSLWRTGVWKGLWNPSQEEEEYFQKVYEVFGEFTVMNHVYSDRKGGTHLRNERTFYGKAAALEDSSLLPQNEQDRGKRQLPR